MKTIYNLICLVILSFFISGCATWDGVKKDSKDAWEVTKETSSDAYDSTKKSNT